MAKNALNMRTDPFVSEGIEGLHHRPILSNPAPGFRIAPDRFLDMPEEDAGLFGFGKILDGFYVSKELSPSNPILSTIAGHRVSNINSAIPYSIVNPQNPFNNVVPINPPVPVSSPAPYPSPNPAPNPAPSPIPVPIPAPIPAPIPPQPGVCPNPPCSTPLIQQDIRSHPGIYDASMYGGTFSFVTGGKGLGGPD